MKMIAIAIVLLLASAASVQAQDLPKPEFTPFTVAPTLTNGQEAAAALTREYPVALRDQGIGGRVNVWFHITTEGNAEYIQIDQSSGTAALDEAALRVASVFRFSPAMNRENRVPVWVSLPITFQVR